MVKAYINQFQQKIQRYSDKEFIISDKNELQKTIELLQGPYEKKTVFKMINSFQLQKGCVLIQAHQTPSNILLSVSLRISEETFEGIVS